MSDRESQALRRFVDAGGMLIADTLCGLMSETGRGRKTGALDELFGVSRNESRGYLNGRTLTEVDGEQHNKPFPQRLHAYGGAIQYRSMIVFERGTRAAPGAAGEAAGGAQTLIRAKRGKGRTLYLNLTQLSYAYLPYRAGKAGADWRQVAGEALREGGLRPRVEIEGSAGTEPWMESMLWRNGEKRRAARKR
ncbi:MAG: hypothetical protein HYU44_00085 [Betaproteobacteria bacterium]|nr:hypothetical protein [Betaproteobacteria bacterium]